MNIAESRFSADETRSSTVGVEPIAVVGVGCRLPGGANDADTFWKMLIEKRSGIVDVPSDRWNVDAFYDPNPDAIGRMRTRKGGFLPGDVFAFDPGFFDMSPREALSMDPQQRMLLELARNFIGMPSRKHQEAICNLARALSNPETSSAHDLELDPEI